jgi:hypothetical protein
MVQGISGGRRHGETIAPTNTFVISMTNPPSRLWLRVHCNFDNDQAIFTWSADGNQFAALGNPWPIPGFQLQTFQGVRPALFNYNISGQPGGYADFDNYTCDEPRARGIEREIPTGKTIVLASSADGSFLAADAQYDILINSTNADAQDMQFKVVDLGLGHVAFQTSNGKYVSVTADEVILKNLAGNTPGDAESFQWINLMRGDTAFMSLANYRYLATKPNAIEPVTAIATGPTPARQDGVCFKWKIIE